MNTSFKLVKSVLDDLDGIISKKYGSDATKIIQNRLQTLSGEYNALTSTLRNPIDYADPVTRFAYVFSYVGAHSSYIKQHLVSCEDLRMRITQDLPLRITCVGGGPGSEMLGLLQACVDLKRQSALTVWLLDREESWSETWAEIDTRLESDFKLSSNFRQSDVTSYRTFENLQKAFSSDIFIMSFFMSEIYSFREQAEPFFVQMINDMPSGSLVLYIDNSSDEFTSYAESVFTNDLFELCHNKTKERLLPGGSEQTSDIEPYKTRFARTPKVQSQASVRVWKKK
ncbi:hypothetical protein ACDW_19230 [Acidovorax sp. DW039]|uniref:hypothetical protein n=1 Tax=Acidovorax sp. DW039 TaxID=3095606 RepID=UPI0030874608|nr:hypothetical protein ACDW_19230 [Acidovorax sp. DW039]